MTPYFVYDVFTKHRFSGNPLAVIPNASDLPEVDFQRIAREFNFSETTFVLPAETSAHTAKIRIFSPQTEMPFAGHPTIGTAIALARLGHGPDMVLELGIGPIACHATPEQARFSTTAPLNVLATPDAIETRQSDRHRSVRCGARHASTHHRNHWAAIHPDRGCQSPHTLAGQDQYRRAEKICPELSASRALWAVCLHPQRRRHTRKNV